MKIKKKVFAASLAAAMALRQLVFRWRFRCRRN